MKSRGSFFVFILSVASAAASSDVFLVEPKKDPYFVQEGDEDVVLPCVINPEYFDKTKFEINWARYNKGQLRMITKNEKLLFKKNSKFFLENNSTTGNYSLRISEVEKKSVEGTYHCNVIGTDDSDLQYSALATLVVLVPPGNPIISIESSERVIEGDFMTVKCVSVGGSPQPIFTWFLPNATLASSEIFTTSIRDGVTESVLHFRVSSNDDGKYVQCAVSNKAMIDGETKRVKSSHFDVLYKPNVFVTPTENLTHLSVEEGDLVNLTCNAISNPAAHSYEWKQLSTGERYQGKIWPIRVDSGMSGDFECRATNELGEGLAVLKLAIQYTPKITVPPLISPNETDDVDIECEVNAVPGVIDTKWIGPNGFKQNGARLTLTSISKTQSGNYTCIAVNFLTVYGQSGSQQRMGIGTTIIDVKRKPGQAQIITSWQNVDVGETIKLVCKTEDTGNPSPSYTWASPSSGGIYRMEGHNGKIFEVQNSQLSDNGEYSCKAYNELGEGKAATINITVIEPARISNSLATEKIFTAGDQGKILECEAQGYPTPVISWLKDSLPVKQSSYKVFSTFETKCALEDFCTQTTMSSLTLLGPLIWSDKGNFTCLADNGSNKQIKDSSSWTVVKILHKPVVLNRKYPSKSLAAADIGSQTMITCKVSARPEPEFHWLFKDSELLEDERHSFHTVENFENPDQYEQQLQIESIQEADYGDYVCQATNGNGGDHVIIELRRTSPPDSPLDFQKLSATSNSILVGWVPQFDGGFEQAHVLEARKIDPFSGLTDENTPATKMKMTAKSRNHQTIDKFTSEHVFNFTGLAPLSTYQLRIQAVSKKGESDFTPVLIASTEDVVEDLSMMSPSRLILDSGEQKIDVEPKLPSDACTLLYVSVDGIWRTSICHTSSNPIPNIVPGREYKARFCTTENGLKCSPVSKSILSGTGSSWKSNVFVPFIFFVFIGLAVCVFFLVCCKTRASSKTSKLSPIILTSLPGDEMKNPEDYAEPRHAEFLITSEGETKGKFSINKPLSKSSKIVASLEYDVSNDCYLQDSTDVLKNTTVSAFVNAASQEDDENEEDRRIVREIIV